MSERYLIEEFLYSNCNKVKRSGDGYLLRCPVCGDSKRNPNKRRCHVDYYSKYDEWIYTCYNGDCPAPSGNIQSLYAHVMGVSWREANKALNEQKYDKDKLKARLDKKVEYVDEEDQQGVLDLNLSDCLTLQQTPNGRIEERYHNSLKKFYIDRQIPLRRGIMVCHSGKYKNRFIIPVYDGDKMVYFQGRSIDNHTEPKYLNPVVLKEDIILNKNEFDPEKYIIVTEGLIDAFMIEDDQGTTCLGASLSDEFIEKLLSFSRKIIIALDNPTLDESGCKNYIKIIEQSRYAKMLKYFFMPWDNIKDMNDLRLNNKSLNIYDYVVKNSLGHFKASIVIKNLYKKHK